MANRIKGITIEIGGDTTKLSKALKGVNKNIIDTQKKLKDVNRLLKLDPTNTELLKQKQKLLASQIGDTKSKLTTLKNALAQLDSQDKTPEVEQHQAELKREIIATEQKLKSFQTQLNKTDSAKIDKVAKNFEKVGQKVTGFGKKLTAGLTLPIGLAGGKMVEMASDYEENLNKVDVAFGDSKQKVIDWSETATKQFGLSKNSALEATSLFGDMGTSMGLATDEAADMSTDLAGLAGDLASFKNIGIDEAMNALKGVFTGETESLKGLGVIMTQTNLEEFAEKQGLVFKNMSQSELATLRYNYVLEKTKNAQGDYANTSDGVANATRTAKSQIENLGTSIGTILLPYIAKALEKVNDLLTKFNNMSPASQKMVVAIGLVVASIGPAIGIIGTLITTVGKILAILPKLKVAFKALWAIMSANPIGIIIGAIAALVAGFIYLWNTNEDFRNFWIETWNIIKATAIEVCNNIKDFLTESWEKIKTTTENVWNGIKTFFTDTWNAIKTTATNTVNEIKTTINNIWNTIKDITKSIWTGIKNVIKNVLDGIKNTVTNIINNIKSTIENAWNLIETVTKGTWDVIKSIIEGVWNVIKSLVTGNVDNVKSAIQNGWENVKSTTTNTWNAIKEAIMAPLNSAWDGVKNVVQKMKDAFNFNWKLPRIPIPKFSISGEFNLLPPSVPSFNVNWNAKGGLFTGPSIVGNQGFGEAGPEYALPLNRTSLAPLASMLNGFDKGSGALEQKLDINNNLMRQLIQHQQKDIVLDSGILVGSTINQVNRMLGGQLV